MYKANWKRPVQQQESIINKRDQNIFLQIVNLPNIWTKWFKNSKFFQERINLYIYRIFSEKRWVDQFAQFIILSG